MERKKVLNIARNIPVPGIKENDIIFRISDEISARGEFIFDYWYPAEIIFPLPFLKGRKRSVARLQASFEYDGRSITSIRYPRLPTLNYSYFLLDSYVNINKENVEKSAMYDLIAAHYLMPDGYMGLKLKERHGIPLVVVMRSGDLTKIVGLKKDNKVYKMYHKVIKEADKIIIHNFETEEYVREIRSDYIRIPHGVSREYVTEFNPKNNKTIICVGQLISRKNIHWLINSFKSLNAEGWKLKIVGDGKLENDLKQLAYGWDNISFLGRLTHEDTLKELNQADLFVLPSERETFGLAYLEAAVNGCALIGKRNTGIFGWLKDGVEALFVNNEKELTEKLRSLIDDPDLRIRIAEAGYKKVVNDIIWEDQIDKYINTFQTAVKI